MLKFGFGNNPFLVFIDTRGFFWLVLLPMRFVDLVRCVGMWVVEI